MYLPQLLLALSAWFTNTPQVPVLPPVSQLATISCLTSPTSTSLEALITCFNGFTVPKNTYTEDTWTTAQPSSDELTGWNTVIGSLLGVDGTCAPGLRPDILNTSYQVSLYTETITGGKTFCILSEINSIGSPAYYKRGWGLVVVPATRAAVSRYIHISAPHPKYDGGTPEQAASIFKNTGAKSLFVAGRHREAFMNVSCVGTPYTKTDPAHDTAEPFWAYNNDLLTWQTANGGCPWATCAWIQFHGKANDTCTSDNVFLSAGLGNTNSSVTWYNNHPDIPVRKIQTQLRAYFTGWTTSLPSDSDCGLTATKNVFGRRLNSIAAGSVCSLGASNSTATGQFAHIEQDSNSRLSGNFPTWADVIKHAMDTTCAPGMVVDATSLLCVPV